MEIKYKNHIVAFVDILGFANMIEEVNNDNEKAIKVIEKLEKSIVNRVKGNFSFEYNDSVEYDEKIKMRVFSDCICISLDYNKSSKELSGNDIFTFLLNLIYLQAEMAMDGIFIRGGISIDKHYDSENVIFSSGLVKSYHLESKKAIYPRIIIDDSVIDLLQCVEHESNYNILNEIIKRDLDKLIFLDYLEYVQEFEFVDDHSNYFITHRKLLEENLINETNPSVLQKYLWLSRYHNNKVDELFKTGDSTIYKVDLKYLEYGKDIFVKSKD